MAEIIKKEIAKRKSKRTSKKSKAQVEKDQPKMVKIVQYVEFAPEENRQPNFTIDGLSGNLFDASCQIDVLCAQLKTVYKAKLESILAEQKKQQELDVAKVIKENTKQVPEE